MKCKSCQADMMPEKRINKLWLVFWGLLFCPIGIIYAVTRKAKFCPRCGVNVYG